MENMMKKIVSHSNLINVMIQSRSPMKRNIALFFIVIASSLVVVQPAFAQAQNVKDVPQKLEKLAEGLVGRIGMCRFG
jgi:hypothetical protein